MDTAQTTTVNLSAAALDQACRALADRGADYGHSVYYKGIPTRMAVLPLIAEDPGAADWYEALKALTTAYRAATGEKWTY